MSRARSLAPLTDVTFCVVDLETTGGSATACAITEVGAVKVRGGEVIGTFDATLDFPVIAHDAVLGEVCGILPSLLEFADGAVLVGHNIRFDLRFLNANLRSLAYADLEHQWIDTWPLAKRLVRDVSDHRLSTLAR